MLRSSAAVFLKRPHLYRVDNLCHPSCPMHSAKHSKPNSTSWNISKKDNWELEKFSVIVSWLFSCQMFMSKFQDVRTVYGHERFDRWVWWGCLKFVAFNELPVVLKPLEKKIIGSSRSSNGSIFWIAAPTISSLTWWRHARKRRSSFSSCSIKQHAPERWPVSQPVVSKHKLLLAQG